MIRVHLLERVEADVLQLLDGGLVFDAQGFDIACCLRPRSSF